MAEQKFEGVIPILRVRSVAASVEHYVSVLGFKVDWQMEWFASVSRGRCAIYLSEGDQGLPGAWVWIGVDDTDALHAEYVAKGAKVRHPPTNYTWAYEMQVEDLDGYVLRLGADVKQGEPQGEWLDMYRRRWRFTAEGPERIEESQGG